MTPPAIHVLWIDIHYRKIQQDDFISLTDIAKYKSPQSDQLIQNRMRNRNTLEFLGFWEKINNPNFNHLEFEGFTKQAWLNSFLMSPKKWIEWVWAMGVVSKAWKYWWTFAHRDIALEFANWISVEFKLYFIKEFQRLKEQETKAMDRNVKRFLTKINYKIQRKQSWGKRQYERWRNHRTAHRPRKLRKYECRMYQTWLFAGRKDCIIESNRYKSDEVVDREWCQ